MVTYMEEAIKAHQPEECWNRKTTEERTIIYGCELCRT